MVGLISAQISLCPLWASVLGASVRGEVRNSHGRPRSPQHGTAIVAPKGAYPTRLGHLRAQHTLCGWLELPSYRLMGSWNECTQI
ncbi:hypothetical protein EV356DRAFT_505232 [Viridothelium virens]|uniref:Secreted protein n=1 Tax=Viridothelium virens TaxID=1048519 RepID=A0A6A6H3T6_VIRVR|nr:hypothetical protein EV356DRAFT_505232 [Viridothelium virens]